MNNDEVITIEQAMQMNEYELLGRAAILMEKAKGENDMLELANLFQSSANMLYAVARKEEAEEKNKGKNNGKRI